MRKRNGPITQKDSNGMQLIRLSTRDTAAVILAGALVFLISNVTRWVREHKARSLNGVTRREIEAKNRSLKKENKRLCMEREILKKAAAFFAKEWFP